MERTANKVLMAQARESLAGTWGLAIGVNVLYLAILLPVQLIPIAGFVASLVLTAPLLVGFNSFFLALSRKQTPSVSRLFVGFRRFWVALGAYWLFGLFVTLWSLLLIIPGIIASFSYAMTFFILADDDSIGPLQAIRRSKEMMRGNKWRLFCLGIRFIGWGLVCILTLGVGFLWLSPYMATTYARFYDDVVKKR